MSIHAHYIPCAIEEWGRAGVIIWVGDDAVEISGEGDLLNSSIIRSMFPSEAEIIKANCSSSRYAKLFAAEAEIAEAKFSSSKNHRVS